MIGNFDCTQFISFDYSGDKEIESILFDIFSTTPFNPLSTREIDKVKLSYFSKIRKKYFFELQFDEFLGEFEEWSEVTDPPFEIRSFCSCINQLSSYGITDLTICLTDFAEKGKTGNEMVLSSRGDLYKELFKMSLFYDGLSPKNLIINVIG